MKIQNLLSITFLIILAQPSLASNFPVTVESCGRSVTFDKAPQRAVIHDQNMSQMAFALQLQEKIVGLTGITGWYKTSQEFDKARGNIPELAAKNPTIENIISVNPDLFFAGWNYGMRINGDLTPVSLKKFDIPVLELTESCAHVRESVPDASMDLLYNDILRLGKVFGVEEKSINLINEWKKTLRRITKTLQGKSKIKVFLYDSGEDKIFTSGRFGMPTALIRAAGGTNVMDNIDASWVKVGIESVMDAEPDFFILVDYENSGWESSWEFISTHPVLSTLNAVKNNRFIALEYGEITPGPLNIQAIEKIANKMHFKGN